MSANQNDNWGWAQPIFKKNSKYISTLNQYGIQSYEISNAPSITEILTGYGIANFAALATNKIKNGDELINYIINHPNSKAEFIKTLKDPPSWLEIKPMTKNTFLNNIKVIGIKNINDLAKTSNPTPITNFDNAELLFKLGVRSVDDLLLLGINISNADRVGLILPTSISDEGGINTHYNNLYKLGIRNVYDLIKFGITTDTQLTIFGITTGNDFARFKMTDSKDLINAVKNIRSWDTESKKSVKNYIDNFDFLKNIITLENRNIISKPIFKGYKHLILSLSSDLQNNQIFKNGEPFFSFMPIVFTLGLIIYLLSDCSMFLDAFLVGNFKTINSGIWRLLILGCIAFTLYIIITEWLYHDE